jgi:6-phosphogluconolactonase/glucosamine-6-phosphate isomerase/deaminase
MRCDEGAVAYEALVRRFDRIDVVNLGLGANRHTASLFPRSPTLHAGPERLVVMKHDPLGGKPSGA